MPSFALSITLQLLVAAGAIVCLQVDTATVIDSLACRNQAPRLIRQFGPALFAEDFDWVEYKRVIAELKKIASKVDDETWMSFVQHVDDERYCTTLRTQSGATLNFTVGEICTILLPETLKVGYKGGLDYDTKSQYLTLSTLFTPGKDVEISDWLRAREGKKLYEIQIEAAKIALESLGKIKPSDDLPLSRKQQWQKNIASKISSMEQAKKMTVPRWFVGEQFETFDEKEAKGLRETYGEKKK